MALTKIMFIFYSPPPPHIFLTFSGGFCPFVCLFFLGRERAVGRAKKGEGVTPPSPQNRVIFNPFPAKPKEPAYAPLPPLFLRVQRSEVKDMGLGVRPRGRACSESRQPHSKHKVFLRKKGQN